MYQDILIYINLNHCYIIIKILIKNICDFVNVPNPYGQRHVEKLLFKYLFVKVESHF